MLYRKNLYNLALNIASTQELDESSVADILRQYGDHLYIKGDYDGAMQQFVKTIGFLQPSYVIRKVDEICLGKITVELMRYITVFRCSTHTQSCDLPSRSSFSWTG